MVRIVSYPNAKQDSNRPSNARFFNPLDSIKSAVDAVQALAD
jgi:hypothetical protein